MRLQRRQAAILMGVAVWNVVTWTVFARNLSQTEGRPAGFYVAHTGLIVVNIVIAAVLGWMGFRAWQAGRTTSTRS